MVDELPTTPPLVVVTPKPEPKAPKAAEPEPPFRHETCADCGEPIADDQDAVVFPYAKVSYHKPHRPAQDPPMPPAQGKPEAGAAE
jgi:hypothetical protein